MAGTIASVGGKCAGFAPDAELLFMRVFDSQQESTTSWFLDAFNHLLRRSKAVDLINLSVGGPDFRDALSRPNCASSLARESPSSRARGTLALDGAHCSIRPMTPPSLVSAASTRWCPCRLVVARADAVGAAAWRGARWCGRRDLWRILGGAAWRWLPASIRDLRRVPGRRRRPRPPPLLPHATTAPGTPQPGGPQASPRFGSEPLGGVSYLEQGSGVLRPTALHAAMLSFSPHASAIPPSLELVGSTCDYMAPLCMQPIYAGMQPLLVNLTIVDSARHDGVIARRPAWVPADTASADALEIRFAYRRRLSTWVGYLGVEISVRSSASRWGGIARGRISLEMQRRRHPRSIRPTRHWHGRRRRRRGGRRCRL